MSGAPKRKQAASEGDSGQLAPVQLMREMGSTKGFDPIPPDQYLTLRDSRYPPEQRLLWWMASKTIRYGHRSPYAVDELGKELRINHAEAELGIDPGNLRRAWRELEAEGRVRTEGRRLYLNGSVTLPALKAKEKRSEVCTDLFPPYLVKKINRLPAERQKALLTEYAQESAAEKDVIKEAVAAARSIFDQRKDTILSRFGIKKIQGHKHRQAESPLVPALAEFVERSVQTRASPALPVGTTPKNGSVQTSASLCTSEAEVLTPAAASLLVVPPLRAAARAAAAAARSASTTFQKPGPGATGQFPYPLTLAKARGFFPTVDQAFVLNLATIARAHRPAITDEELASCVVKKPSQKVEGLFIKTVGPRAQALNEYAQQAQQQNTEPTEYVSADEWEATYGKGSK